MFLEPNDANHYPKCTTLITALDHRLKSNQMVLKAFMQACTADDQYKSKPGQVDKIARRALKWATPPKIEVVQGNMQAIEGGEVAEACGYHKVTEIAFGRKPFIEITSVWFDAVEFGDPDEQSKNFERLTRTLLHETVHWVRNEAGASDMVLIGGGYRGEYKEAGRTFEEWAYGSPNVCTAENIADALLSIRK